MTELFGIQYINATSNRNWKKGCESKIYSQNFEQHSSQDCENVSHGQSYLN